MPLHPAYYFYRSEVQDRPRALTFDDVLCLPRFSDIKSRRVGSGDEPDVSVQLKSHRLSIPVLSANMDSVTGVNMAKAMFDNGGLGVLHRYVTIEDAAQQVKQLIALGVNPVAASVGVNGDLKERAEALVAAGASILTVDIAHGHCERMLETLRYLKKTYPTVMLIAGNVATPTGTEDLIRAGADVIKVGIGPGAVCTTRLVTGCGLPQFTAIAVCSAVADSYGVPVIADGGIRSSGDIVKAIAAGASAVMLGSLLAGTDEAPGEHCGNQKVYRGMASSEAQIAFRGRMGEGTVAEGVATMVPSRGRVSGVLTQLMGGLRAGMGYLGAHSLNELEGVAFVEQTAYGVAEAKPHGS